MRGRRRWHVHVDKALRGLVPISLLAGGTTREGARSLQPY